MDFNAFETEQQFHEYLTALKQRMLPLKFAYIGRAAHTHDELVRSQEYGLTDTESNLIRESFISSILPTINGMKGLNVIDIGSGNGNKALVLLNLLHQNFSNIEYIGLDYSKELSQIAVSNISNKFPCIKIKTYPIDFESSPFHEIVDSIREKNEYPNMFLFLGQTFGNPVDRLQTLLNVYDSMEVRDALLVGIEYYQPDKIDYILEHYRNEPFYRAIFNPLTYAGLQREDGVLEILFNEITKDVETYFKLINDVRVQINNSEYIEFKKDDKILLFISHRFAEMELRNMFKQARLHIHDIILNDDNIYALIFALRI
jgi:uncharacterized SAM-dependent methyltransferase